MTSPAGTKAGSAEPWLGSGPREVHVCTGGHSQPGPGPRSEVSSHRVSVGAGGPSERALPAFSGLRHRQLGPPPIFSQMEGKLCCRSQGMSPSRHLTRCSVSRYTHHVSAQLQSVRPVRERKPPVCLHQPARRRRLSPPGSAGPDKRSAIQHLQKGRSALTPPGPGEGRIAMVV